MIVNTQVFNYRLTIVSIIAVVIAITAYGFVSFQELQTESDYLRQEKRLLLQELSDVIDRYDALDVERDSIYSRFEDIRQRAESTQDSLVVMKADMSLFSRIKSELNFLKSRNKRVKIDSLNGVIQDLTDEMKSIKQDLETQQTTRMELEADNKMLRAEIRSGSKLFANSFRAQALLKGRSGLRLATTKANKAEYIEVCFVLAENPLADSGIKELYLQILDPDNNVINDKGAVEFGERSLIFSSKELIEYNNTAEEHCIQIPNEDVFKPGIYFISLFEEDRRLGGAQIELN